MLQLAFIVIGLMTLVGAVGVVTARNLFHAALFLVLSFFGVAGLFITLQAEFLAATQVLVYIGAISVLMIFAIMLSRSIADPTSAFYNGQWRVVSVVVVALFVVLVLVLGQTPWPVAEADVPPDTIARIGAAFVNEYVIPFQVASVLLAVALIGATMLAREREQES